MKSWLSKHWKTIGGAVCGAAAAGIATVNPVAGLALGAVCGGVFGRDAATLGQKLAELVKDLGKADAGKK